MTDPYSVTTIKEGIYCSDCLHCKQETIEVRDNKAKVYHMKKKVFCKRGHPSWKQKDGRRKYRSLHTIRLFTVKSCIAYESMRPPGETMEEYLETLPCSKDDVQGLA